MSFIRERERETETETDRQTDKETQRDKEAQRERERETETERQRECRVGKRGGKWGWAVGGVDEIENSLACSHSFSFYFMCINGAICMSTKRCSVT